MSNTISSSTFKKLLFEAVYEKNEFTFEYYGHSSSANIDFKIENGYVIIRGQFELTDDITFKARDIYNKSIVIDGGNFKNIIFTGGNFNKFVFRRGSFDGYVSIRGGAFNKIVLLGGNFKHWLGTLDGIRNFVSIDNKPIELAEEKLEIKQFEIEGGTFAHNIWINGGIIKKLEIRSVSAIKLHCSPNEDKSYNDDNGTYANLYDSKPKINDIVISRYINKDSFYQFNQLSINTLSFISCTNLGNTTFSEISINKLILFENSDVGKTSFVNCNFIENSLKFKNSKLTEISLTGTNLPTFQIDKDEKPDYIQASLAMSQIKKVYQNMGDYSKSYKYKAEELKSNLSIPGFKWDKINLFLNKLSNDFEQSWARALMIILIGNIFLFSAYCRSLGYHIEFSWNGVEKCLGMSKYLLEFINPIRKFDTIPGYLFTHETISIGSNTILIDSLSKLFNAYMIYQFISAFRRHGKN